MQYDLSFYGGKHSISEVYLCRYIDLQTNCLVFGEFVSHLFISFVLKVFFWGKHQSRLLQEKSVLCDGSRLRLLVISEVVIDTVVPGYKC